MASHWSRRHKLRSMVEATESDEMVGEQNIQSDNAVAQVEVKRPQVAVESGVYHCCHPDIGRPEVTGDYEQISEVCENSVSPDKDNDCDFRFESSDCRASPFDSDNSDTEAGAEAPDTEFLITSLRYWASTFSVLLVAVTALLGILHVFHPDLPKDARTVLRTQGQIRTMKMDGGDYHHFGLLLESLKELTLQFNIDGLPLFKSSKLQFWPILAIANVDYTKSPFLVGLGKPKSVVDHILKYGIIYNSCQITVKVCSFVCDAPARAFIKNIKAHNVGEWKNNMTYPEVNAKLRTDADFQLMIDEDHHLNHTSSPLAGMVKMITIFPLDYMHLCCLGVTRKLIYLWMKGKVLATRLSSRTVGEISEKLKGLGAYTPNEFNRKPRELSEIDRWKATELQNFMLYTGPVVLRNSIPAQFYDNFMLFSVAMHLLLSPCMSNEMVDCANEFLVSFVCHFGELYGRHEITYNIHQLKHLSEEYRLFGPLDNIAVFPYENYLGQFKHLLRKPHLPLQQIVKRLSEKPDARPSPPRMAQKLMHQHYDGPFVAQIHHSEQYKKVVTEKYILSLGDGNNYVQVVDDIALIRNIVKFCQKESYYQYRLPSCRIGCFRVWQLNSSLGITKLHNITSKYFLCPDNTAFIAMPIIHSQ
ncbi:hypothetical protein ACER0C_009742 [Sarotherodon galilaeus]